ncbi:P-loop containing nucleoside triphosphate hydrolase protein [Xylona heveae TC161]|uniref:Signal recognition particle receptor subunit beta n=1 Tax=Xylona heveae (strain CBS 132557 / TC161) TaxID=1328760 RepID=A0A165FZ71_XYLHT|nr:P-loop containing nucleoside triphosphate hydrolase protein [Xylona heveae TC161]KZF21556.1 P-loop containing nucleoside triphosphate hydrolase protein [Xylona heveae TC161]
MTWAHPEGWLSQALHPSLTVIVITIAIALAVPLFLHFVLFRSSSSRTLPSFLIVGPSGAGKTSLLTLFERGSPATTHTSQTPLTVEAALPVTTTAASNRYRSSHDPSSKEHKIFLLVDTPGHGKLRHHAFENITSPQHLKGIVFLVDAANLSTGAGGPTDAGLREAAEYLHDILLMLQKRAMGTKKVPEMPLLIAANKQDLFTALPAPLVKAALEAEITKVRESRSKGLLDSGIGMGDSDMAEEKEWLGEGGEGKFEFAQMEDVGVSVTIAGGSVLGGEGPEVGKWWDWIAESL